MFLRKNREKISKNIIRSVPYLKLCCSIGQIFFSIKCLQGLHCLSILYLRTIVLHGPFFCCGLLSFFWHVQWRLPHTETEKAEQTSLVNVSLKFQMLISELRQYFWLKKCEKLLHCKSFSHFFQQKVSVYLVIKS